MSAARPKAWCIGLGRANDYRDRIARPPLSADLLTPAAQSPLAQARRRHSQRHGRGHVRPGGIPIPLYTLNLTLGFDHDIVDGAPAARFAEWLRGLIESGYGLKRN